MTNEQRLLSLWDHLGLAVAHVATQMAGDIGPLVQRAPERIGGVVLCVPARLDPAPFVGVSGRITLIAAEHGLTAGVTARAQTRLPNATRHVLAGYDAPGWADVVADRTSDIVAVLTDLPPIPPLYGKSGSGTHEGITYAIQGHGPPLVLFPFFLAPSQWEPAIAALARHYTVIVLGGRYLGGVAALEDRAAGESYQALARTLWDSMAIRPGDTILDVGCGSGALDRLLAPRLTTGRIVATDVNRFLLKEAAALAADYPCIGFQQADAEQLPFADATFDAAFSVTVLEECDADRALAELHRVVKPRGRVGVVVRAIDLPQWWNLDLPEDLKAAASMPPQSVGAAGAADASLYPRMRKAGFENLACFPTLVTFANPDGPIWRYREDHILSQLTEQQRRVWQSASQTARDSGLLFMVNPMHCATGARPMHHAPGAEPIHCATGARDLSC